jgi:hypothetical protein
MRTSAIFARVMAVFAVHQQLVFMVVDIVSKIWALIFGVAYMLVHLEFLAWGPLTFYTLSLHLRAAFFASITAALSCEKQGLAVIKISAEETTILINSFIGTRRNENESLKHLACISHSRHEELLGIIFERQVTQSIAFYIKDVIFEIHPNESDIGTTILSLPNSIIVLMR